MPNCLEIKQYTSEYSMGQIINQNRNEKMFELKDSGGITYPNFQDTVKQCLEEVYLNTYSRREY